MKEIVYTPHEVVWIMPTYASDEEKERNIQEHLQRLAQIEMEYRKKQAAI